MQKSEFRDLALNNFCIFQGKLAENIQNYYKHHKYHKIRICSVNDWIVNIKEFFTISSLLMFGARLKQHAVTFVFGMGHSPHTHYWPVAETSHDHVSDAWQGFMTVESKWMEKGCCILCWKRKISDKIRVPGINNNHRSVCSLIKPRLHFQYNVEQLKRR